MTGTRGFDLGLADLLVDHRKALERAFDSWLGTAERD